MTWETLNDIEAVFPFWMDDPGVKCKGIVGFFYPDKSAVEVMRAKDVCNGNDGLPPCPFRRECLHYAIDHNEIYGVWAGTSERDRRKIRRARRLYGKHIYTFEDVAFPNVIRIPRRYKVIKVKRQRPPNNVVPMRRAS
jgi:WhiB family transcriptional regulator, redox-sensing transcriptional regulator